MHKILSLALASSLAAVVILGIDVPVGGGDDGGDDGHGGGAHTNGHTWCC